MKTTLALFVTTLLSVPVLAEDIRKDTLGHLHTPNGTYKQDALGNWEDEDGDTYRKNALGQWTNGERTFRENGLGQLTDGDVTVREGYLENRWEVK